jgi:hypothetical protein
MTVKELLQKAMRPVAVPVLTAVERIQTGAAFNPLDKSYRT